MAVIPHLKPGDVFTLPDGLIVGNIVIPRGLSGTPEKPIVIQGGVNTIIKATDATTAAIVGGGCKWITLRGFATVGGRNGVQISQNGAGYDPAKMIEGVTVENVVAINPVEDGIKLNGGRNCHVIGCTVRGGTDQGIDLLGIDGGSIRGNTVTGSPCGILVKGGARNIAIMDNRLSCVDGIHVGEVADPKWQAPWTDASAEGVTVEGNQVVASGNPIVTYHDRGTVFGTNLLWTSKLAKGVMAPLVEIHAPA